MKRNPAPLANARRRSGSVASVAAILPLALSMIPSRTPSETRVIAPSELTAVNSGASRNSMSFNPGCKLPFDEIKTESLDIDTGCTVDGNAGDDTAKRLESNAKNNFCVSGKPTPITFETFEQLQAAVDDPEKKKTLKAAIKESRDDLKGLLNVSGTAQIGEGSLVQFVAFVLDAHNSNVGKKKPPKKNGELVNCNQPDKESNDIHIELVMDPSDDDGCNSLAAEMSPHFRPESWSELVSMQIKRPVRITGPLFFDGSHQPCKEGKRPSPERASVWEIHPVYQFEVCKDKSLAACKVQIDSEWIPLDRWHSPSEEEPDQ
jgi:hypothetical protein